MKRVQLTLVILFVLLLGFGLGESVRAQSSKSRPGNDTYKPTKIEWAALELQANYGNTEPTSEAPVMVNYTDSGDGFTIICALHYRPGTEAEIVKGARETASKAFEMYAAAHHWNWLKISFDERVLRAK